MEQKASGVGVDSLSDRDKDSVVNDFFSKIAKFPTDEESLAILSVFYSTNFTFGQNGINGLDFLHLQKNLKWHKMSRRKYTPVLMSCVNMYIKGINSKAK